MIFPDVAESPPEVLNGRPVRVSVTMETNWREPAHIERELVLELVPPEGD